MASPMVSGITWLRQALGGAMFCLKADVTRVKGSGDVTVHMPIFASSCDVSGCFDEVIPLIVMNLF